MKSIGKSDYGKCDYMVLGSFSEGHCPPMQPVLSGSANSPDTIAAAGPPAETSLLSIRRKLMKTKYWIAILIAILSLTFPYQANAQSKYGTGTFENFIIDSDPILDTLFIGSTTGNSSLSGQMNVGIGNYILRYLTTGSSNIGIGNRCLWRNTTGNYNTAMGTNVLFKNDGGSYNTAVGLGSLYENISGNFNTGLGYCAISNNLADGNTALGFNSLRRNTTGAYNLAVGVDALSENVSGNANTAVGSYDALHLNVNGNYNTAIGHGALYSSISGNENTALGYYALCYSLGNNNIGLGTLAGYNITTGSNNIAIGYNVTVPVQDADNQLNIGNIIYGNLSSGDVTIPGKLKVGGPNATLQIYANNDAAIAGGLAVGDFYRTGTDPDFVCVVH